MKSEIGSSELLGLNLINLGSKSRKLAQMPNFSSMGFLGVAIIGIQYLLFQDHHMVTDLNWVHNISTMVVTCKVNDSGL